MYDNLENMYKYNLEDVDINLENKNMTIENMTYGSTPFGSSSIGSGAALAPRTCPVSIKYSGDPITLQATPKDGIGPYNVVFRKNGIDIDQSRLIDELGNPNASNPIIDAPEDTQITRVYTLYDTDIAEALTGTIDFSVFISDSCPTTPRTCEEQCTINIGCIAPVCNFIVT